MSTQSGKGHEVDQPTLVQPQAATSTLFGSRSVEEILSHLRVPLFRNAYALLIGSATTSLLGFLYLILAARFYPTEVVGLGTATISAMLLLSGISQLSLNSVLTRFLPRAGHKSGKLIVYSYLASALLAALVTIIFLMGLEKWSPALLFLNENRNWQIGFILATMLWCIFALQDSAFTGLRAALWVPFENTIVAILKIILLLALAKSFQSVGIFASWNLPVLLSILPVNLLIFGRLVPKHVELTSGREMPFSLGTITRFIGGNYLGSLFFLASTNLLPVIVTNIAGVRSNAHFYPPWMIVISLQLVAVNLTTSLTVEAALDETKLRTYTWQVLKQALRLEVPLAAIIFLGAPLILSIFGPNYAAEGTPLLRILVLGALPNILVTLAISLARVQHRAATVIFVQGALASLVLGLSLLLLPKVGIIGGGIASLISQTVVALIVLFTELRSVLKHATSISVFDAISNDATSME